MKRVYESQYKTNESLLFLIQKGKTKKDLVSYQCERCGFWHLGQKYEKEK